MISGKSVLVTGGSGSFGRRFAEIALQRHDPARLIVYSRDEHKQFVMSQALADPRLRFFIGDVRDLDRLTMAMRGVDVVIHAAALKHVSIAEYNPMECVKTNVLGAENVVQAAIANKVRRVVALSTDKACNPVSLYGATKLASDKIFIASNNLAGRAPTRFCVVRYGNVMGSRGSVVPLFHKLIADGADHLPVTDERMTRFWITLDQGVGFVLDTLRVMQGGELFVPKIPAMKMMDLAHAMAPDLPVRFVGVRPGEKLHEVMIAEDDARHTVELEDRYVVQPALAWWTTKNYSKSGKPVPEGFRYASDNNPQRLAPSDLRAMVSGVISQ